MVPMRGNDLINSTLPDELILEILRNLDSKSSRDACSLVCRRWLTLERFSRDTIRIGASGSPDALVDLLARRFPNVTNVYIDERLSVSLPVDFILVEIPYVFTQTLVYCIIVYSMIGFEWTTTKFFWYIFFQFTLLLYMTYYGMMTVAITPNANIASVVAALFYGVFNMFSGFIIPRPKIPVWWRWYYWCNPFAWTVYGMAVSQFGDYDDVLLNGETVKGYLDRYFGFKHSFLGTIAGVQVGLVIVFGFIFSYCIKSFNFQKR